MAKDHLQSDYIVPRLRGEVQQFVYGILIAAGLGYLFHTTIDRVDPSGQKQKCNDYIHDELTPFPELLD